VPALVFPGLTVVISPLISLMKDQVDRLQRLGVSATFLNSTIDPDDAASRLRQAEQGTLKLIYVAPERFEAADLGAVLARCNVSLLAVDEAHCISEWGHEFRPSFRRIASVAQRLRIPQTMALTATATPLVRDDISRQLQLRAPSVIVAGFDRTNLQYAVEHCPDDAAKDRAIVRVLRTNESPAIVYAPTRAAVERVARVIMRGGLRALPYHGGLAPDHRQETQDAFMSGAVDWMVATNAFGMGIDKPNVRLVAHYAMPATLEAYYQEAGRAGRDGAPGRCVLLHAPDDRLTHEWFISGTFPPRATIERMYERFCAAGDRPLDLPTDRVEQAAVRFLIDAGVIERHAVDRGTLWLRLLATPARISRELTHAARQDELDILRALWRKGPEELRRGHDVRLRDLNADVRSTRSILERLRASQFLDVQELGGGFVARRPGAPLAAFRIDWRRLAEREATERAKLASMEGYTTTMSCRRAFVLRYFGEQGTLARCAGCDNCQHTV
jgi:ATP-dependent DNA helicase RecQ